MVTLRLATADDFAFLAAMLLEAAAWNPERTPRPTLAEVLATPELAHYIEGWPRPGDFGVVAEQDGTPIGAAWCRSFTADDPGYGFVADHIPEVSIGVIAQSRGRGIGAQLLTKLAEEARANGIAALSLSVERANPALRLYERMGYRTVAEGEDSSTMVLHLG